MAARKGSKSAKKAATAKQAAPAKRRQADVSAREVTYETAIGPNADGDDVQAVNAHRDPQAPSLRANTSAAADTAHAQGAPVTETPVANPEE